MSATEEGPWVYDGDLTVANPDTSEVICVLTIGAGPKGLAIARKRGAMIAALPDVLSAAVAAASALENVSAALDPEDPTVGSLRQTAAELRVAIAKAEGRE